MRIKYHVTHKEELDWRFDRFGMIAIKPVAHVTCECPWCGKVLPKRKIHIHMMRCDEK